MIAPPPAPNYKVVWSPLPGSQTLAVTCPANMILYHGSRGPGKTDSQLMYFRAKVGQGYGAHWRGIIFDREYKNLDDLVAKSERWFSQFNDGARFIRSKADYCWRWPTGEILYFRSIKRKTDYYNYHGQEFPFIGWNELTKFPDDSLFNDMLSCNRTSFVPAEHSPNTKNPLPELPLTVFATTNPYGVGHTWVKKRFIDPAPPGILVRAVTEVFNPRTQQREPVTKTQVHLFGSYMENRFLTPEYVAELENTRDPNKRKAWLAGDWNIIAGGMFDDLWTEYVHIVPRFKIPKGWYVNRSFDWGGAAPFSVGWWAQSDGTNATLPDGRIFCPRPGSIVRLAEWYGCDPNQANTGLKLSSKAIATGIKTIEEQLIKNGWLDHLPWAGPADNAIRNKLDPTKASIAEDMANEGITWTESNKDPGSRELGAQTTRDRLENALSNEGPGLYAMSNCRSFIGLFPNAPRDEDNPDDVDTDWEDHIWDETRYRVLDGTDRTATSTGMRQPT